MQKSNSRSFFDAINLFYRALDLFYEEAHQCSSPLFIRPLFDDLTRRYLNLLDEFDKNSSSFSHSSRQAEPATTSAEPK